MADYLENFNGLIPDDEWLNIGFNVTRQTDPIDGLFGDEKTDNITARWQTIANEYQIPMMAQFHGFDTEAKQTFRVPVDNHNIEKGLIKVKINQSELMREYIKSGVRSNELADYVLNDGIRLADQVVTRTKVAKNELMATGKVTIKENNLDLTVDYGVDSNSLAFTIDTIIDDVFGKIQDIIDAATAKGVTITGMLTSKAVLTKLRRAASVQTVINGSQASGAIVRRADFDDFMSSEFGINEIITNDLTYGADAKMGANGRPTIASKRYYPADKITFFATNPNGRVGTGLWGDPPEVEINGLGTKVTGAQGSPYVYVTQYAEKDPAVIWTKASGLFIPVLYNPASIYVATVTSTGA